MLAFFLTRAPIQMQLPLKAYVTNFSRVDYHTADSGLRRKQFLKSPGCCRVYFLPSVPFLLYARKKHVQFS
jgi:hypothetical protein